MSRKSKSNWQERKERRQDELLLRYRRQRQSLDGMSAYAGTLLEKIELHERTIAQHLETIRHLTSLLQAAGIKDQ
jgi:hypothetical protein